MGLSLEAAEVLPGRGLGPILFGTRPEEVQEILGEANESSFTRDGEYSYVQLAYSFGLKLYFSVAEGMRLDSFEIDSRSTAKLFGESLFPRTQKEILALLGRELSSTDQRTIQLTRKEGIEEIVIRVAALGADFYFDLDEALQAVHLGVFFNEEDEIAWPV